MSIKEKIIGKIKESEIKPDPRWKFLLKDYIIWIAFALAVFFGSLSFAVVLFFLTERDWDIYKYLDKNFAEYVILSLPYFWIIFIAVFIGIAYYNWKHTKKGYKCDPFYVVLVSVGVSLFLGSGLYAAGLGKKMDQIVANNLPHYKQMSQQRIKVWNQPEKGLLSGEITSVENNEIIIKDFEGKDWVIKDENINKRGKVEIKKGERIKIIGDKEKGKSNAFEAEEVRPWERKKGMNSEMKEMPKKNPGKGLMRGKIGNPNK